MRAARRQARCETSSSASCCSREKGQALTFGGQVMKNVAGSLGTLGLILEASLKVLPRPFAEATPRFEMDEADALKQLNQWGGPAAADLGQRLARRGAARTVKRRDLPDLPAARRRA
ncbi:hypothetical protein [Crenobacter cavernae]|uniref:hypothetical protein n=1 Tax=Crenobacter cavernae TaxID=2290923 RepID=UPI001C6A2F80|nr:hypothetical protein [Crenobacter cavernae]